MFYAWVMRDTRTLAHARAMRRNPSSTETLLWRLLRDRRLEGLKFRRQVPIGRYVADFACAAHKLIVEADGPHHDAAEDAIRDGALRSLGWRVLRFPNAALWDARRQILGQIVTAARGDMPMLSRRKFGAAPHPSASLPPSPCREKDRIVLVLF